MGSRKRVRAQPERVWWASDGDGHLATFARGPFPGQLRDRGDRAFGPNALSRRLIELPPSLVPQVDVRRMFASAKDPIHAPSAAALRSPDPEAQALVELESLAVLDDRELLQSFRSASKRRGLIRAVSHRPACVVVRGALPWLAREWTRLGVRRVLAPFELDPLELGVFTFAYRASEGRSAFVRTGAPRGPLLLLERLSHHMRAETISISGLFAGGHPISTPPWNDEWVFPKMPT